MKTTALILVLLVAGKVIGQTFENPIRDTDSLLQNDFGKWYFQTGIDDGILKEGDTVKFIIFRTKEEMKSYEKQFMKDHHILSACRYSELCTPSSTYYKIPGGHSMIANVICDD